MYSDMAWSGDEADNGRERIRTVTMDSEDAEDALTEVGLIYDDPQHILPDKLNTMRQAEKFCDVSLKVGCRNILAHRAVLACASNYLFELFNDDSKYYVLDELEDSSVDVLVNYAYTGRLEVARDRVKDVYRAATLLKMPQAAEACSHFLADNLSTINCLGIRSFANSHCDGDLTCRTDDYIQQNLNNIKGTAEMQRLPTIQIEIIGVTASDLQHSGERHLARMVVDWLEHALLERLFQQLCEDCQVLYLSNDNKLYDCLDVSGDASLSNNHRVQDYQRLGKRKKMVPVKASKDKPSRSPPHSGPIRRLSSTEKLASFEKEWKVVATKLVTDNTCVCVAMLEDRLTNLSLCFRPYPEQQATNGTTNGTASMTAADSATFTNYDSSAAKLCSPKHSPPGSVVGGLEKQCSLTPLTPMSMPRCALGTAVLDGGIVALGGYDRGECHNTVERFDQTENAWTALPPMTVSRGRFDAALVAGKLYACGGSDGSRELNTVECYDPVEGRWSQVASMLSRRSSAGVSTYNDKLYIIGGWSGTSGVRDCEVYDPKTGKWESIAKLNIGRSQVGVCAYNGKIIAIGGSDAWNPMNSVELYDPELNTWSFLPAMATNRRGVGAAVFKDKVYAVGGSDGHTSLMTIEIYDGSNWTSGPALSTPRANVSVAVLGQRLFAIGGFSGKLFLDTIEFLADDEWCGCVPRLQSHSDDESAVPIIVKSHESVVKTSTGDAHQLQNGEVPAKCSDKAKSNRQEDVVALSVVNGQNGNASS